MYRSLFKPLFDRIGALLAIIILGPIILVVAVMVRVKLGSPVIFSQIRPGKDEKLFKLFKFRSMTDDRDKEGELLDDISRLNRFGKFLRSSSLDELPELFNILKGEMSFVGPRPLLVQYLPLYDEFQRKRHETKPGLTGLAQISGRNALSWEEKFALDIKYLDCITFTQDAVIVLKTLKKVFLKEDVNAGEDVTMEYFQGTES